MAVLLVTALGGAAALTALFWPDAEERRAPYPRDAVLRVNDVQVLGTHNSYHLRPGGLLSLAGVGDYEHASLTRQLNRQGVRSFELDVYNGPGFPVLHTPRLDAASNCSPISQCLGILARWSTAHPGHVPIFVLVEARDHDVGLDSSLDGWDAGSLDRLDDTVRAAFGTRDLLTPDDVRGKAATLRGAVLHRGWPTLRRARGKFVVVLNRGGPVRELFVDGHPSLEGRAMFVTAQEDEPSAAFIKRDQPREDEIRRLVRLGFVVRSRADADLVEAHDEDLTRARAAIRSGAQVVSTDFPVADRSVSGYVVRLPGSKPARCNPVNARRRCRPADIESPRHLADDPSGRKARH